MLVFLPRFLLHLLFIFTISDKIIQIVANFVEHHATSYIKNIALQVRRFCFHFFVNRICEAKAAKVTQNEKWLPFGGRCIDHTETNLFEICE